MNLTGHILMIVLYILKSLIVEGSALYSYRPHNVLPKVARHRCDRRLVRRGLDHPEAGTKVG